MMTGPFDSAPWKPICLALAAGCAALAWFMIPEASARAIDPQTISASLLAAIFAVCSIMGFYSALR